MGGEGGMWGPRAQGTVLSQGGADGVSDQGGSRRGKSCRILGGFEAEGTGFTETRCQMDK